MSLASSYQQFAIKNSLSVIQGMEGGPFIEVNNKHASALISIYGAQVLSYKSKKSSPKREYNEQNSTKSRERNNSNCESREMLFVSELAYFEATKAIKGGIPICWPWFGKDPENRGRQMHGFARNSLWRLEETALNGTAENKIVLSLTESKDSYELWSHDFKLVLTIIVGETLQLSLKTMNTGKTAFTITQALHAYFSIADIQKIQVDGLDQIKYIDTVNDVYTTRLQVGKVTVNQEVDRIYMGAPSKTRLIDEQLQRKLVIDSKGSNTTVVWNPWIDISNNSADLTDDAYQRFICVETANAAENVIVVEPNQSFTIEAKYTLSGL